MQTIQKTLNIDINNISNHFTSDRNLFLDIETTGFSHYKNQLFLIGCGYIEHNQLKLIQWFAENEEDEYAILYKFIQFSKNYDQLIHYNGDTFDIPFLKNKANRYNCIMEEHSSYDIYKKIRPHKSIIGLTNCQLKTIEKFLNLYREDSYSGKEIAENYKDYLETKNKELVEPILIHNQEDIAGLISILPILDYSKFCEQLSSNTLDYSINTIDFTHELIHIKLDLKDKSPLNQMMTKDSYAIHINENEIHVTITLFSGELKHYFKNYKDYYYIISEDQAFHKSVAQFVDSKNRQKAKAQTCYIKRRGQFLPLPQTLKTKEPLFMNQYHGSAQYVKIDETLMNNMDFVKSYVDHVLIAL